MNTATRIATEDSPYLSYAEWHDMAYMAEGAHYILEVWGDAEDTFGSLPDGAWRTSPLDQFQDDSEEEECTCEDSVEECGVHPWRT